MRLTKEEKQRRLDIEQVCVLCRFVRGLILDKVSDNPILQVCVNFANLSFFVKL